MLSVTFLASFPAVAFAPASRAATAVSPTEYLERVDRARALANAAQADPAPEAMEAIRKTLGLPLDLVLAMGAVRVGPDPLLARLDGREAADFRLASAHLLAMAEGVRAAAAAPAVEPDAVDAALSGAYEGIRRPNVIQRIVAAVKAAGLRLLRSILDSLGTFRGPGSLVAWALVLALGVGIVILLRRLGFGLVPETATARREHEGPIDWQAQADAALRLGDLREATRALYRALVAALAARGLVPDSPSTTAGECRIAVARAVPRLAPAVAEATSLFERVAYGGVEPAPADVEPMRAAVRAAMP